MIYTQGVGMDIWNKNENWIKNDKLIKINENKKI